MRTYLLGFHPPHDAQFSELWRNCVFIFDTSFLLNIYRYDELARSEMLSILKSIKNRVWLPSYAALEFQRNRPKVIADQKKKFSEVRKIVEKLATQLEGDLGKLQLKKRHNLIDVEPLLNNIRKSTDEFLKELALQEEDQIEIHQDAELRHEIESLFDGRIGSIPSEEWMQGLVKSGKHRFEHNFPPGYCDVGKGTEADPVFTYGGVSYDRKYGDLIIWKQIIDFSKSPDIQNVIFLTDDKKEDWWWIVEAGGTKRLGPRPELVEEITRCSSVNIFHMYNSEQFLQHAKTHFNSDVSDETIEQARQASEENYDLSVVRDRIAIASIASLQWIDEKFPEHQKLGKSKTEPDFLIKTKNDNKIIGIEYIPNANEANYKDKVNFYLERLENRGGTDDFDLCFILVILYTSPRDQNSLEKEAKSFFNDLKNRYKILFMVPENENSSDQSQTFKTLFTIE